jgi:hypothetical protein
MARNNTNHCCSDLRANRFVDVERIKLFSGEGTLVPFLRLGSVPHWMRGSSARGPLIAMIVRNVTS